MSDKNHNLHCAHAAEIVSYLYDEIGNREKEIFDTHLEHCRSCAAALADFSFARFAVKDWRDTEFSHLKTPVFEIPFEKQLPKQPVSDCSHSWLADLRRSFSLSSIWAPSAAAFVVIVGLVLAANNLFQPDLIADNDNVDSVGSSASSSAKNVEPPQPASSAAPETAKPFAQSLPPSGSVAPEKREIVRQNRAPENRRNSVETVSAKSLKSKDARETGENGTASRLKISGSAARQNSVQANRPTPTLNGFDAEEDNTLRLAEMFDEIDAGK